MAHGWQAELHAAFTGEHVLFSGLRLDGPRQFAVASVLVATVCLSERLLTHLLYVRWEPLGVNSGRVTRASWRTMLYWSVMLSRVTYMLISMTFNIGLILVIVTSLSIGQFLIEYVSTPDAEVFKRTSSIDFDARDSEPLLHSGSTTVETITGMTYEPTHYHQHHTNHTSTNLSQILTQSHQSPMSFSPPPKHARRARAKSKPEHIVIHPRDSNIARADAFALRLGLGRETELVKDVGLMPMPAPGMDGGDAKAGIVWEVGKGKEVARELLGHVRARSKTEGGMRGNL